MNGRDDGPSAPPRVKICGVGRAADVRAAADAGAAYVGLVLADSPRRLAPRDAAGLARAARDEGLAPVGVVVDRAPEDVAALADRFGLGVVQLHGDEPPEHAALLREAGLEVWKAIRPRGRGDVEAATGRYGDAVDALLLEGWSPERAGGTGTSFPLAWLEDEATRRSLGRLVLAGGLDSASVGEAIRRVAPDVVDVSTGVEASPGRKDPERIRAFVAAALAAGGGTDERGAGGRDVRAPGTDGREIGAPDRTGGPGGRP